MKVDTGIAEAGCAALSATRRVGLYTEDVLLINDYHWGTTCATVSCMPTKAMLKAATAFGSGPFVSWSSGPSASVKGPLE